MDNAILEREAMRLPTRDRTLLADGLDWETFCVCDHLYSVETAQLKLKRGKLSDLADVERC